MVEVVWRVIDTDLNIEVETERQGYLEQEQALGGDITLAGETIVGFVSAMKVPI